MANTVIQLKYSNVTGTPPALNVAEPAYSNVSNKLWIDDGSGVVAIGGKHYTGIIDAATSSATGNTIVLRDNSGNFSATTITANLTGKLTNARTISLSGDANGSISFDASQDVTISVDLTASGVTAGVYGSTTKIPTFQVDTDGRIISASNVNVATSFSFSGDTGAGTLDLLTDTLTYKGGDGITTTGFDANNTVTFDVDNTVVKTDRSSQTINGDIAITGNLIISGNTITQDVETIRTEDSLIGLAANNVSDALDIGFYGQYVNDGTKFAGLVRDSSDGKFKLFVDETDDPTSNVVSYGPENIATIVTNLEGNTAIIVDGTFTNNVSVGNELSVTGTTTLANNLIATTATFSGDVTIGGSGSSSTTLYYVNEAPYSGLYTSAGFGSNETPATSGIDGSSSPVGTYIDITQPDESLFTIFTSGTQIVIDQGSGILTEATITADLWPETFGGIYRLYYTSATAVNPAIYLVAIGVVSSSTSSVNLSVSGNTTLGTMTVDSLGNIDASSLLLSTALGVASGGTGNTSFTSNHVILGNGTGALTTVGSSTEGHLLTINASGAPTFQHLNGGSF